MTTGPRGHVAAARPPVVAMAAAGSTVVRRVEELGDLAQAHIQQLSEAAGEDGEGAEEREAGGRTVCRAGSGALGAGVRPAVRERPVRGRLSTAELPLP